MTAPLAGVAAAAIRAADTAPGPGRGCLMAVLVLSALVTGLQRRRRACPAGVCGIWELAAIVLAPVLFAVTVPAAAAAIAARPARRLACVLGPAAAGLTDGAVSAAFHAAAPPLGDGTHGGTWLLAVAAAGVLRQVLACAVGRLAAHGEPPAGLADGRELARGELAELCAAVLVTCSAVLSPLCVLLAVPLATPLLRSLQHTQLARDARTDRKTGLLNAAAWQDAAGAEITRAVRARLPLAMVLLDVDHFKTVNDTHGHLAGDQVLHALGRIITSQLRDYDIAGRYGGEEFAVLLPHTQPGQARQIAERLRIAVAAGDFTASAGNGPPARIQVTVSAGVASLADAGPGLPALISAADEALYDAKAAGRNRVRAGRRQPPDTAVPAARETRDDCGTPVPETASRS